MSRALPLVLLAMAVLLSGCQSQEDRHAGDPVVDRSDGVLQKTAAGLARDLIEAPAINRITDDRRPVLFIDRARNRTSRRIDSRSITDAVRSVLADSGCFRLVSQPMAARLNREARQPSPDSTDLATAAQMGRQLGADYVLYGYLSSVVRRDGDASSVHYQFTLKVLDIRTGVILWSVVKPVPTAHSATI